MVFVSQSKDVMHLHFKGHMSSEFRTEIESIPNLRHKNIIALLGCCVQAEESILIYEYMPNKCLASVIAGKFTLTLLSL